MPIDSESLDLLEDGLRKTMLSTSGAELDAALAELGWADMLVRHARAGNTAGVPAAGRNRFARIGSQRRGASTARPRARRDPAAAVRRRWLGGVGLRTTRQARRTRLSAGCRCAGWTRADRYGWRRPAAHWAGGWSVRRGRC